MRLRIMPALMAVTTGLIVATTITFGSVVDRFAAEIIVSLVDRQFSTIERSVSVEIDGMVGRAGGLLQELRTLAEQGLLPVDDTPVLERRLVERLRQQPQLTWISYGDAAQDRFVGVTRRADGLLVVNHAEPGLDGGRPQETLIEPDGRWVARPDPSKPAYSVLQQPWFRNSLQHDTVQVTGPYTFAEGRVGITLSLRWLAADGTVPGVFTVDFLTDDLSRDLSQLIGGTGDAILLDSSGNLIASAGTARSPSLLPAARSAFASHGGAALGLEPGSSLPVEIETPAGGFHAGLSRIQVASGVSWILVSLAPRSAMRAPLDSLRRVILIIAAALVAAGIIASTLFAARIARPLNALSKEADRIRSFDFDDQIGATSRIVELDNLIRATVAMKAALRSFGRFVPKRVVKRLIADGGTATLGGDRRELTVMFSDIAGFTRKSESLAPERMMQEISRYFDIMAHEIQSHQGIVDKFIGDGIMALWNAPRRDADHAGHACAAVLACMRANDQLDAAAQAAGAPVFPTRYGLHSGEAVVGNIGSADRMQYTALGATVNLASRLESLNKHYRTRNLVSAETRRRAGDRFLFRSVAVVMPAGMTHPVEVFELLGAATDPLADDIRARIKRWQIALSALRGGQLAEAMVGFQALAFEDPEDGLAAFCVERCATLNRRSDGVGMAEVDRFGAR
jgi:adenylate cyclase